MTDEAQLDGHERRSRPARPMPGPEQKRFKFPTALTVLAIVLLVVWMASFFIPSGVYEIDPKTGDPVPGSYHELPDCSNAAEGALCSDKSVATQFELLWRSPPERPVRHRERHDRARGRRRAGLPLRLGADLPLRAGRRRVHHDDDEDRRDRGRHRPAGAAVPAQPVAARRRADVGVRARRHDVRHVGGDAGLLRPHGAAGAGAGLRPHGRRRHHRPRRRHGRARARR